MHPRIAGSSIKLLNKDWDAQTKRELQLYLDNLSSGSDQAQIDIATLEAVVLALLGTQTLPDPVDPATMHPFMLAGA